MKIRLISIILVFLCVLSACGSAPMPTGAGTSAIFYKRTLGEKLELSVFTPEEPNGAAILVFHGGGWVTGSKEQLNEEFSPLFAELAARGITVITADYRLALNGRDWTACLDDCTDAYQYLRRNAKKLGLDASRIGVMGYSAGAHLALMLAVSEKNIPLCISLSAPTVMTFSRDGVFASDALVYYRGLAFGDTDQTEASPTAKLGRRCDTSFLLVNGAADPVIPYIHAETFVEEAEALKVDAEAWIVDGLTHAYTAYSEMNVLSESIADWAAEKFEK